MSSTKTSIPSSPIARLQKAAKRAKDEGDMTKAEKMAKTAENLLRYEAVAREHGADLSEERFNEALRKVARQS